MAYLVLVRHGVTEWNERGIWHGLTDLPLSNKGIEEARQSAKALGNLPIHKAYTSDLSRTKQTYQEICNSLSLSCPVISNSALNERDYGMFTGKNKWEVEKELGPKEFLKLRRGWNQPIPGGETLQDVYGRVVPYYEQQILKDLKSGENVLVVSSGNTLRALIKYLENLSEEEIANIELGFGDVYIYEVNHAGQIVNKEIRLHNENANSKKP